MTLTEYQIVESTSSASTVASYTAAPSTTYPSEILGVSISISSQPDSFSYDVIYYLDSYTNLSVAESSFLSLPVDLTWSIDGTTSITYSLVQIGNSQVPSWVSLSSTSSSLVMTTPDVSTNTNFTFGVQATVSGYNYIKKYFNSSCWFYTDYSEHKYSSQIIDQNSSNCKYFVSWCYSSCINCRNIRTILNYYKQQFNFNGMVSY